MFNLCRWWVLLYIASSVVVAAAAQPTSPPKEDSYGLYSHFDPAMAIVVMVLVCAFFIVGFFSIYIRQCAESNAIANEAVVAAAAAASAGERSGPKGLDPAVIVSFPVFVYSYVKDLKMGKGALECAVCLSEFEDDDTLRLIPKCSHVFHPDCIDAWLECHVTCPVCRAKLTPDPDAKPAVAVVDQSSTSNGTEPELLNSNNNNIHEPSSPAAEGRNELVIQVDELDLEPPPIGKITGKFPRSHSTGHSLIQLGENVERYTLRLPEEIRKQIVKGGRLKRTRSYDVVLGRESSSSRKGGEGSSRGGKSYHERYWAFFRTPPFVSRTGSVKCNKGGEASNSWRGLTSVKEKLSCLNVKVDQNEKQESWRSQSPV